MPFTALIPLISAGASLLGGIFGGQKSQQAAQQASQGARLQDLLPYILPSIQTGQQAAQQNYALQQQRYANALPLQQAVMRMTMGLMPNSYGGGGFGGGMQMPLGMPSGLTPLPMAPNYGTAVPRQPQRTMV
jgi:hypothetical protein